MVDVIGPAQIGWICPVCGRGLAPSTPYCGCTDQSQVSLDHRDECKHECVDCGTGGICCRKCGKQWPSNTFVVYHEGSSDDTMGIRIDETELQSPGL